MRSSFFLVYVYIHPLTPFLPLYPFPMLKQARSPYGYRNLLAYQKAEALQKATEELTHKFPGTKTLVALADQMDRSARSAKQNIVEGWKRNSTGEYYQFLGFTLGSNAELEEDCLDIWKGFYAELMGEKGVMGEMGGEKGERGLDVERLPFYPLDPLLPPVVQLLLRSRELNFLLERLQKSLAEKMGEEGTLSSYDRFKIREAEQKEDQRRYEALLVEYGMVRLPDGRVIPKGEKREKREGGDKI